MISTNPHCKEIILNDCGVSYIESGDYEKAVNAFTNALKKCQETILSLDDFAHGNRSTTMEEHAKSSLDSWMACGDCQSFKEAIVSNEVSYTNGESSVVMHPKMVRIPEEVSEEGLDHLLPVSMMFNLALAHHLLAIEKNLDQNIFRKAAKLYRFVAEIQVDTEMSLDGSTVFFMTTLNNLGHVYRQLGDISMSDIVWSGSSRF